MTSLNTSSFDQQYIAWLDELKQRIQQSRLKATLSVNRKLILLYWQIGREILERQQTQGWGSKVVTQLSKDLRQAFPEMTGLSRTNLLYMRAFAEAWTDEAIVQQPVGQIPWGHNCVIIDKLQDEATRIWYIQKTIEFGWSRNVLVHQIETQAHLRLGNAQNNFATALDKPHSELVGVSTENGENRAVRNFVEF